MRCWGFILVLVLSWQLLPAQTTYALRPPLYSVDSLFFQQSARLTCAFGMEEATIEYQTLDEQGNSSKIQIYTSPVQVSQSTTVLIRSTAPGFQSSEWRQLHLKQIRSRIASLQTISPASDKYPGEGPLGLIDNRHATSSFRDVQWMGFDAPVVQLEVHTAAGQVDRLLFSFLQDPGSWILAPKEIRVMAQKGDQWIPVKGKRSTLESGALDPQKHWVEFRIKPRKRRGLEQYRIELLPSMLPASHPGAGSPAWIFIDEIACP